MKRVRGKLSLKILPAAVAIPGLFLFLSAHAIVARQQSAAKATAVSAGVNAKMFNTLQQAADELVDAAEKFDVHALEEIFGPDGDDIVLSGEYPQDRQRASDFDAKAGRQELLQRRIGADELDAIDICRGYVEAQHEYALQPREGFDVNQYAQRIISNPGKQDGLAWQNPDGSWGGPIGEKIARVIEQGYSPGAEPYHGYFFKILKGQGPAALLGEMDYVVKAVMIGGFALVAAPAEYGETGLKTFIVSEDGVVYERDFGPGTLNEFTKMERFNPDGSWAPVMEEAK